MDIGPTDGVRGPGRVNGGRPAKSKSADRASDAPPPSDKVEISEGAKFLSEAIPTGSTRPEVVEEIRRLLESGRYETDERLEAAIDELLRQHPELMI
ncbi:MAG: flagellar biosynthesis anti-sigma factor FlgM [Planctomycetota bacterium]|jgi:anti-sigma28 factor (negative regulator of flagellin synthesis)